MSNNHYSVLDHGYVRYIDHLGNDLSIVNAAKASFQKESDILGDKEKRLLVFLARSRPIHASPFRHGMLTLEIYAPLMIARQWWKYVVGSDHTMEGWNESSRRYVTENTVYYIPQFRSAPEHRKQGSGDPVDPDIQSFHEKLLRTRQDQSLEDYERALADGIAPEQARVYLHGYALYVRWRWTASMNTILHFLDQRVHGDAQSEIRQYAEAVEMIARSWFPFTVEAWRDV